MHPTNRQPRETPDQWSAVALYARGEGYVREVSGSILLAARRWQMDDASTMAAAVAYYLSLSIFPMWLLLTSGVGLALKFTQMGQDAEEQIFTIVAEHCSPTLETQVRGLLVQLEDSSTVSGPIGLVTAVLAAIGVFHQFERGFDKIWRVPVAPGTGLLSSISRVLTQRLAAFCLLACLGITVLAILATNLAISAVEQWMKEHGIPGVSLVVLIDALATVSLNALVFGMLYKFLPKRPIKWADALRGGLLVAIIWEVGRQILSAFLIRMTYTNTYGAAGSLIALLLWFYWGLTVVFFGAEYVQVLSRRHARPLSMFKPNAADES
ncbi:MAG TPA: hypothetical protein DDW52_23205 [Planctomycetaceae bacterium]|nr:hypothetical protein [Planctomycetaceae bacterium]